MFFCAGDRGFFREHCVPPADFLRIVWRANGDTDKILAFVKACTPVLAEQPVKTAPCRRSRHVPAILDQLFA